MLAMHDGGVGGGPKVGRGSFSEKLGAGFRRELTDDDDLTWSGCYQSFQDTRDERFE